MAMRSLSKILAAALVLMVPGPVAAQAADSAFVLTIVVTPEVIKPGSEVRLSIILTNTTGQQILLESSQGERDYKIEVRDAAGGPAGKTKYYRMVTGDQTGKDAVSGTNSGKPSVTAWSSGIRGVQPGKSVTSEVMINKLYDFGLPGKYVIQAERMDEVSKTVVKSNILTLTVTD